MAGNYGMRLAVFHLLNDLSGSPKVLSQVVRGVAPACDSIDLHTSGRGDSGALDDCMDIPNVRFHRVAYSFAGHGLKTIWRFAVANAKGFMSGFKYLFSPKTVFYINTILPVGAALSGRLTGHRVIYHYHENARTKGRPYRTLARVMQWLASDIICVSEYQRNFLARDHRVTVVPNALPQEFVDRLLPDADAAFARRTVLMTGSLNEYKGLSEYVALAHRMPQLKFVMVVNGTYEHIENFRRNHGLDFPSNLTVYPRQNDMASFYNSASVVLNLTDKTQAVESFGLSVLEALTAGLPVIVPTVGGVATLVEDGINGWHIDASDLDGIVARLTSLFGDTDSTRSGGDYRRLSANALTIAARYSEKTQTEAILNLLTD